MILDQHGLLNSKNPEPTYEFYLSDLTKTFEKISKKFFGNQPINRNKLDSSSSLRVERALQ
jgi:hypothetical protein